jgi:hypothetical protein
MHGIPRSQNPGAFGPRKSLALLIRLASIAVMHGVPPSALAAIGGAAPASEPPPAYVESVLRVKPNARLLVIGAFGKVETRGRDMTAGGFETPPAAPAVEGGAVGAGDARFIEWTEIDVVKKRENSAGTGAVVGAFVFGAAGLAGGLAMAHPCEGLEFGCGADGGTVALMTVTSAALGTLTGSLVGLAIPHWKTIYKAPGR